MDQLMLPGCKSCGALIPNGSVSSIFCDADLRVILEGCATGLTETFVEHPDYPGYWVSSFGQVRDPDGKLMKPNDNGRGYLRVEMPDRKRRVHHLILEGFIGPQPKGLEGCHWDNNPRNNVLMNIRWDDHEGNMRDVFRGQGWSIAYQHRMAKLHTTCAMTGCDKIARSNSPGSKCQMHYMREPAGIA